MSGPLSTTLQAALLGCSAAFFWERISAPDLAVVARDAAQEAVRSVAVVSAVPHAVGVAAQCVPSSAGCHVSGAVLGLAGAVGAALVGALWWWTASRGSLWGPAPSALSGALALADHDVPTKHRAIASGPTPLAALAIAASDLGDLPPRRVRRR